MDKRQRMKEEAIDRLNKLEVNPEIIDIFKTDNVITKSEGLGLINSLTKDENKIINDWAEETKNLPYHAILTDTQFGVILNILYVSNYEDDWDYENFTIESGNVIVYAINLTNSYMSDIGIIGVAKVQGGLVRTTN